MIILTFLSEAAYTLREFLYDNLHKEGRNLLVLLLLFPKILYILFEKYRMFFPYGCGDENREPAHNVCNHISDIDHLSGQSPSLELRAFCAQLLF